MLNCRRRLRKSVRVPPLLLPEVSLCSLLSRHYLVADLVGFLLCASEFCSVPDAVPSFRPPSDPDLKSFVRCQVCNVHLRRETTPKINTVFFSSRRRHTRCSRDWSSDVCSSD